MNNNIKDTTSLVFVRGKNLFNKNAVLKNCELLNNGADVGYNILWFVSDYIEVEPNTIYYLSGNRTGGTTNAFYDENKTFISYVSKITGDITTPSNAKYIRFNGRLSEIDNNIMLEQNSTATSYEAYVEKEILVKNGNGVFEEFYNENNFVKDKDTDWIEINNVISYKKSGKMVTVKGYSTNNVQLIANDYKAVATLPEGVRPKRMLAFPWTRIGEGSVGIAKVNTNGTIELYSTSAPSYWAFTVTYII